MVGKIPIVAAKNIAHQYGLKQCLLIGFDGELAHVVTYGRTKADCEAAAKAQDFWTGNIREFSFKGDAAAWVWKPIETCPKDGTNFMAACVLIADEYDDNDRITRRGVRERYARVAQYAFGAVHSIPWNGGTPTNETFTHWAPIPDLPPDTQ